MTSEPRSRLSSCHRHPSRPVTGFCASCLRERFASIHPAPLLEIPASAVLRRRKSFSAKDSSAVAVASELPSRRSCEVRTRSTLWDLFNLDDERKALIGRFEVGLGDLGFGPREEDENVNDCGGEIRATEKVLADIGNGLENEIVEAGMELKTMKELIDLEWRSKKSGVRDFKDIAGSFWEAASVFSKKLRKRWQKQKIKKHNAVSSRSFVEVEKRSGRRWWETQSEIGEYGVGSRSCDTDPRLSVDVERYSFDEPRASWDGCLIGKAYPRLTPMVALEKKMNLGNEEEQRSPGGSAQTKDYYSETPCSQRWRSFDRSNSHRKGMVSEFDDLKLVSNANAKESPVSTYLFYGAKLGIAEEADARNGNPKCAKNDDLGSIESVPKDAAAAVAGATCKKGLKKLSKWPKIRNIFGLIQRQRRSQPKCGNEEEKYDEGNVADQPFGESWQKLRRVAIARANVSVSQKLIRSYTVNCRNSYRVAGLQQNRTARYSSNNLDNGLLRFSLTPLRSYRRSKSGRGKLKNTHSKARTLL
ncbi:protein OCTOPUS-like [Juglans microcarpa x Juglans regia]|uniref:protein OCTOPUS-like n=1 Tax=Juglans microcarpa x Juglans regia TaxID=2249226 RepID=UPI001B7E8EE0|nr:protein OCTOPUS-like [Juglans microcarpa x Juglans regia]